MRRSPAGPSARPTPAGIPVILSVISAAALFACGGAPDATARSDSDGPDRGEVEPTTPVPDSAIVLPRITVPPRIDGIVDEIWSAAPPRPLRLEAAGTHDGPADLSAEFRALYDADALYVLFVVTDDARRVDSPFPFDDDAVELYIDAGYERADLYDRNDVQFVFGVGASSFWATGDRAEAYPGVDFASVDTESGYVVEVRLAWADLGVTPAEGRAVGIELHVDDDDDGGALDLAMAWNAAGPSYSDASLFGAAVLGSAEPESSQLPAPVPARAPRPRARLAAVPSSGQEAANTLSEAERAAGFQLLFDGESLDAWRGYRTDSVPGGWSAEAGLLTFDPEDGRGDLVSRDQYQDFELTLEWMISEGGNSGIFFRVSEDYAAPWETGPEMQVLDDARHPDGRNPLSSAGANFALHAPPAGISRPAGEWNRVRILVDGNQVRYWLNDELAVEYVLGSEDWEERVAASKFAHMPGYGRESAGHIVLQDHGDPVWYRNLKVRRLEPRSSASTSAGPPRVLVFSRTAGYRHESIEAGVAALHRLAEAHGLEIAFTEDGSDFSTATLAEYDVVVFLNTTGDVLAGGEEAALESFIRVGGGFVGVHAAADTEYEWPWYGGLVGAYLARHARTQAATVRVVDPHHPSVRHLPAEWRRVDEWYDFDQSPPPEVHVLLELDEASYRGGGMGESHPIAWYHEHEGGRAWYTGLGHTSESYQDPLYMEHLLGGIRWASGSVPARVTRAD